MNQFENVISWDKGLLIVIITIRVRQSTYVTQEYVTQSEKCFIPLIYNAMEESLSKSQMYIINRCEQDTKLYPVSQNITCLTTSIRMIFSSNYIQQKEGRMITKFLNRPIYIYDIILQSRSCVRRKRARERLEFFVCVLNSCEERLSLCLGGVIHIIKPVPN
jgi:hypothetical protein